MSIVAAENAGLGPCDLPDSWAPNTNNSNNNITSIVANSRDISSLSAVTENSSNTAVPLNIDNNISSNIVFFKNQSSPTTTAIQPTTSFGFSPTSTARATTSTTSSLIYKVPLSSPAAATAAVTVSPASIGSVVTSLGVGLVPSIPTCVSVTGTSTGGTGAFAGVLLSSPISAGGSSNSISAQKTITNYQVNNVNNNANNTGNTSVRSLTLPLQQQQLQLQQQNGLLLHNKQSNQNNNNSSLVNNNHHKNSNNFNLILRQKAAATVSLAAALQNSITMNAVASPISNNPATPTRKIRRKTDPKANLPQSQINKCNNEKRRRELENNYIEQLSEFLQLNKRGDTASTKPDKAAILNQVVKTYREFCDKGQSRDISSSTSTTASSALNSTTPNNNNSSSTSKSNDNRNNTASTRCLRCATDNCSIHPVQQGDVSSTEPPLPEPSLLNGQVPEISAYFEALEHYLSSVDWVLLQVTADGIIESCTQNIRELIGYDKQELFRKPLYQYLHSDDHAKLNPIINNMPYGVSGNATGDIGCGSGSQSGWNDLEDANSGTNSQHSTASLGPGSAKAKRNIAAKVRMLVKDLRSATQTSMTHQNDALDQKTVGQHINPEKYEEVMLLATPMKDDGDTTSSILCLITRPEDEPAIQQIQPQAIEHLTFKLDVHGKILNLDVTALRQPYRQHLSSWLGRLLQDLCHPQDLNALKSHLREVQESAASVHLMNSPSSHSPGGTPATLIHPPIANVMSRPFRLRLGAPDVYVHVKANSRLFLNQSQTEGDYIMSLQTLLNTDNDIGGGGISGLNIGGIGNSSMMPSSSLSTMSPSPSLVSPLSLPLDSLVNNNSSCSSSSASALASVSSGVHMLGGLVGGGGMPPLTTQTTNVGGPLMTSAVINGTGSGTQRNNPAVATSASTSNNSNLVNSFTASPAGPEATIFYSSDPFDFDLAHSSFEMDATGWTDSRPNSRASVTTPVSTPRPPSAGHGFSPAVCASPSTPYQLSSHSAASLPSPQSNTSQPSSAGPGVSGGPFGFGFPAFETSDKNNDKDHMNASINSSSSISGNNSGPQGGSSGALSGPANLPNGGPPLLTTVANMTQLSAQPNPPQPESERLRHLLTNKSHSMTSGMNPADGDKDHLSLRHKFYNQSLLNSDDDKDGGGAGGSNRGSSGMFKMGATGISNARLFGGGALPKSSNSSNPMLLSLLNEKSEDDDGKGPSLGRQSELMRQLQKDDGHYSHSHGHSHGQHHSKDMSQEDLLKSLKYQGDPTTRKRSLNEPDDGILAKRESDRPSKLRESNKMLASLLENPPKNPIVTVPPQVKTIPDIAPSASRVNSTLGVMSVSAPNSLGGMPPKSGIMTTTSSISAGGSSVGAGGRSNSMRKQFSDAYLTLQQQQHQQQLHLQQQQQQQQCLGNIQRSSHQQPTQLSQPQINFASSDAFGTSSHNTTATSGTANVTASIVTSQANSQLAAPSGADGDSELSKILDSVMDYVSDDGPFVSAPTPTALAGLTQQEINERMAINAIQNSLMVETSQLQQQQHHQQQPQPPAYPGNIMGSGTGGNLTQQQQQLQLQHHLQMLQRQQAAIGGNQQSTQVQQMLEVLRVNANQSFQRPPPMYSASRNRGPMNTVTTPGGSVLPAHQQYRIRQQQQQQQQQKERLLQQQQKQQLLVPESATARTDQLCLNPNINNIGSLLNNTVAPNVALSRTNLPPDSQLSPNFAQNLLQQQQLSPGQRNAPFSPQTNAGYAPQYSQSGQRLSPHHQQHISQQQQQVNAQQQQQMAFQAAQAANANVTPQLSPRQPPFGGGAGGVQSPTGMPSSQQWNASGNVSTPSVQLSGNVTTQRGHSLQQHNPMLSAQLQQGVSPYTTRPYQNQRRSLNSPNGGGVSGNAVTSNIGTNVGLQRQNSFQGGESGGFSGGTSNSPSPQSPYGGPSSNVFQQQQMQRMQRQSSVPQTTQHLPGSPRPFIANVNHENIVGTSGNGAATSLGVNGGVSVGGSVGIVGFGGMMYNNMQHAAHATSQQTQNEFYGRAQAGNAANSSDFVKQELRAIVSGRAQQQAAAAGGAGASSGGNGVPGGGGGNVGPGGLRITSTPQSPLSSAQQGPMSGGNSGGLNSTNSLSMQQHQSGSIGTGVSQNALLNTPDPSMNFSFDAQDFFGNNATR
ncbi:nuclear receptor coactivator 2 isoform X3 [Bactrocera dorsalis]|uniref:Nuclear receptor coactivator 2 isoform X3 n=1 Tax=Bactrocera dorsalis TaxID=27457 RepID=A0ABM3JPK6_BACDO|nr:nuclear receptor coactivator 2 isoform X3 [Bactrocera dorsalis]